MLEKTPAGKTQRLDSDFLSVGQCGVRDDAHQGVKLD